MYGIENFFGENKTPEGTLKLSVQENENITLLKAYYNQAIPQAGQDVKFELPGRVNILDFHCPVTFMNFKSLFLNIFFFN